MKPLLLILPFFISSALLGQVPFCALGAEWGGYVQCSPAWFPCAPGYPFSYTAKVTEDTIIQGKYCTIIPEQDWWATSGPLPNLIVHQDGHQIYRYDRDSADFKLVMDFEKNVGESWQIEVPKFWTGNDIDTLTVTVTEKDGPLRRVNINEWVDNILLYEGFGGVNPNCRMFISPSFFYVSDPFVWDELTCYSDPVEGLLYGSSTGCMPTSTSGSKLKETAFRVFPNPASTQINIAGSPPLHASETTEWILVDAAGKEVQRELLSSGSTESIVRLDDLPEGIYFWKIMVKHQSVETGKLLIAR